MLCGIFYMHQCEQHQNAHTMYVKYTILHIQLNPQDEPTRFETCRKQTEIKYCFRKLCISLVCVV